ncbi:MAG: hypothetical protein K1X81_14310 [Bacteroidia bacterium]|nr:hypothetical protein [Bacteroidia bacterium]
MKHLNLVLLLIAFSSLGLHCKKEEPSELSKLPPITNFGAQTFGCLINGKAWTAEYGQVQIDFFNGVLSIKANRPNNAGLFESLGIYTYKNQINAPGRNFIPYNTYPDAQFVVRMPPIWFESSYPTNKLMGGGVTITRIDTINYYMAGTFNFTLFDESGTTQVNITEGRFDYKYH